MVLFETDEEVRRMEFSCSIQDPFQTGSNLYVSLFKMVYGHSLGTGLVTELAFEDILQPHWAWYTGYRKSRMFIAGRAEGIC